MRQRLCILSLLAILVASMAGCNTNGCMQNRNSVPKAGFYDYYTQKSMTLDSVEIYGAGLPDTVPLSAAGKQISSIYLPMRSTETSTTWVLSYKWAYLDYPQLNDTISFDYESTPFFASNDCGVIYKYQINKMTHTSHLIDSIALADSLITNVDVEQIRIYFRTDTSTHSKAMHE